VLDRELAVGLADEHFTEAGELADSELGAALFEVLAALLEQVRTRTSFAPQLDLNRGASPPWPLAQGRSAPLTAPLMR
jgi:hypothetical protein